VDLKLLAAFRDLFEGKAYLHRVSSHGDWVAQFLFEDLRQLEKSAKYRRGVDTGERVLNTANRVWGKAARRGDGTFGELVPGVAPRRAPGFTVQRGPIANVEIGVEAKILAKAMIKQIDRVINDLDKQAHHFKSLGPRAITVALVGVNHADRCIGYEGSRQYPSETPPSREAPEAIRRIHSRVGGAFDELIFLRYAATNEAPFAFSWVDEESTRRDCASALTRISRLYDSRF